MAIAARIGADRRTDPCPRDDGAVSDCGAENLDPTDLETVVRTTFAARAFTDEDVSDAEVAAILDTARFAPSGGNRQGWRVVVVRDTERKAQLVECGIPMLRRYVAEAAAGHHPLNTVEPSPVTEEQVAAVDDAQLEWYRATARAPVMLVIGVDLSVVASVDAGLDRVGVASGASIYPFVQNILLVARSRGLSGVLTTFAAAGEQAVQALLGLPSHVAVAAVVPLGHPTRVLTRLSRRPVESFARLERWDGDALSPT
jgi:nitroreductase